MFIIGFELGLNLFSFQIIYELVYSRVNLRTVEIFFMNKITKNVRSRGEIKISDDTNDSSKTSITN